MYSRVPVSRRGTFILCRPFIQTQYIFQKVWRVIELRATYNVHEESGKLSNFNYAIFDFLKFFNGVSRSTGMFQNLVLLVLRTLLIIETREYGS